MILARCYSCQLGSPGTLSEFLSCGSSPVPRSRITARTALDGRISTIGRLLLTRNSNAT